MAINYSEDFIRKYEQYFDESTWDYIAKRKKLSEEFMLEYKNKLNPHTLYLYQQFSYELQCHLIPKQELTINNIYGMAKLTIMRAQIYLFEMGADEIYEEQIYKHMYLLFPQGPLSVICKEDDRPREKMIAYYHIFVVEKRLFYSIINKYIEIIGLYIIIILNVKNYGFIFYYLLVIIIFHLFSTMPLIRKFYLHIFNFF